MSLLKYLHMDRWRLLLVGVNNMETVSFKASKRVYIVFGIMFGGIPIFLTLIEFLVNGFIKINQKNLIFFFPFLIALLVTYIIFSIYKVTYNNKQIKYRGLFGTKLVNIDEIKNYKIKAKIHTISTKPIFGLFKITINDPTKPVFGLAIDTLKKKSEIIIPAKLFSSEDLNKFMEHIENKSKNLVKSKRKKAGKSVFTYLK